MEKALEIRKLIPANERNKNILDAQFNYQIHLYFYQLQYHEPLKHFEFDQLFEEQFPFSKEFQFKCTSHPDTPATHCEKSTLKFLCQTCFDKTSPTYDLQ